MCLRSIVLCCIISLGAGSKAPQNTVAVNTTFTISISNNILECGQTRENPSYVTVQEDGSLRWEIKFPGGKYRHINSFQCSAANNLTRKIVGNYENKHKSVLVQSVNGNMAGIWYCTIFFQDIKPQVLCLDDSKNHCAEARCFVKVHIRLKETPQNVLVNNMIVSTKRTALADKLYDHVAEYRFLEGDIVNVLCVPGNDIVGKKLQDITLQYDFAAKLNDVFKRNMQVPSERGYGFRTQLQREHDNTTMICNYTGPEDYTIIQVKFLLLDPSQSDDYEHILINGSVARQNKDLEFKYLLFKSEVIDIGCDAGERETSVGFSANDCRGGSKQIPLKCVCVKNGRDVKVSIQPWSDEFKETVKLTVNLPVNNTVMELYNSGGPFNRHSWIYYEYDIDDTILPKCTPSVIVPDPGRKLAVTYTLNGKELDSVPNMTLKSTDDNKLFECFVIEETKFFSMDSTEVSYYKNITVLLRKRVITTTSTSTTTTSTTTEKAVQSQPPSKNTDETKSQQSSQKTGNIPIWQLALIGVATCVILVCVFSILYKMKKRNRKSESGNNYENIDHTHNEAIPAYPQPWRCIEEQNYQVPVDRRRDDIYAEPISQPDEPYATPVPKSQRPPKVSRDNPEPTYAELNIPSPSNYSLHTGFDDPQYATAKELYSHVIPKNARENRKQNAYDNTFPNSRYVNSKNSEYVEPTYCQPHRK